uniref:Uncharacterized protein n=1 Tax=Magallana gigas TaxID=29159 RepID=K1PVK0_MAGGI
MACRQKKGRIFIVPGSTVTREPGSKFTLEKPVSWTSFAKRLAKKQLKNLMASVTEGFLFEIPNTIIFIVNCSRANTHPILMRRNGRMERDDILSSDRRIVAIK